MRAALIILLSAILIAVVVGFVQFFRGGEADLPDAARRRGVATEGGIYRSEDGGSTFSQFIEAPEDIDLSRLDMTELFEDPALPGTWWVATAGAGLFVWDEPGSSPPPVVEPGAVEETAEENDPTIMWLPVWGQDNVLQQTTIRAIERQGQSALLISLDADKRGRIWRSENLGASFHETYSAANDGITITALAVAPTNPNRVLAGLSDGLVIGSGDGGETWSSLTTFEVEVQYLTFAQSDAARVYGLLATRGPIRSVDGGATFEELSRIRVDKDEPGEGETLGRFSGGRTALHIAVHPSDPNHILLATAAGLLRSTDGGRRFVQLPVPIKPDALPVRAAVFQPGNANTLLVTAGDGLYVSFDGGANWRVTRFTISPDLRFVRASSRNGNLVLIGTAR